MGGYGIGVGIGDAMGSVADAITKRKDRQYAETTDQADKLMDQMKAVAGKVPRDAQGNPDTKHPQYAQQQEAFGKLHDQYSALFPNPGAMARHLGKKQRAHVDPTFEGEMAAAPAPKPDASQQLLSDIQTRRKVMADAEASGQKFTDEQKLNYVFGIAPEKNNASVERKIPGSALPPGTKDAFGNDANPKGTYTKDRDGNFYPEAATEHPKKPPVLHSNTATGGLEAIEQDGVYYHQGNMATAPLEVKSMWESIMGQQKQQTAVKNKEERERFDRSMEKTNQMFQMALDKDDYKSAKKIVDTSDTEYRAAIDRQKTMSLNLKNALKGDQQAMLSLVANHIGMTLGAQKGSRINRAVWDEAVQSAPWLAKVSSKFDDRGILSGITLAPEQMKQMVDLADEKVEILKSHLDGVKKDYSDALGVKKSSTPGGLKKKANGQPASSIDDEIMKAINQAK